MDLRANAGQPERFAGGDLHLVVMQAADSLSSGLLGGHDDKAKSPGHASLPVFDEPAGNHRAHRLKQVTQTLL